MNLYRDGDDAVARHGDTVRKFMPEPPVRRTYLPGEGDLLVMGGRTQHESHHTVPRDRRVPGARMSVTLRHSRPR